MTAHKPTVVFDGGCGYCRRQERRVRRLDWFHRFETMPYDQAITMWPEVARGTLGDGLRVRFPDGTVTVGIAAVRSIAIRMPATVLLGIALWLPGLHTLGRLVYGQIVKRRSRDDDSATCALRMP